MASQLLKLTNRTGSGDDDLIAEQQNEFRKLIQVIYTISV